ncbi:MAG: M48 family metalloprotease [Alphaproteobacteria bacterium]|nr:M48 family metalloprotease [Alphaproteobacteria bacterium]
MTAAAQPLVLDEEFNQFAHTLTRPLRAQLVPNLTVNFVLVNAPDINAFVTLENLVYLNSGLVLQAKNAGELQGVLAHELGHLAAGHLNNRDLMERQALLPALAGAVLGAGAAVAGAPQAAVAAMLGGQALGIQNALSFSRLQESEADQRAVQALHAAELSAAGMTGLFQTLRTDSQLSYDSPPPWLVTHPLPAERLARLMAVVEAEPPTFAQALQVQDSKLDWARLQAKVAALTQTPASVLRQYPGHALPAKYARALAFMRQGKLADAAPLLAQLREADPTDPFYTEAAAQLATMQGNLTEAAKLFQAALQAQPNGLLIRYQLAEVLRAQGQAILASKHYRAITQAWPIWSEPWEGLGRTLGQQGQLAASHLAFAEAALADGDLPAARQSLALAQTYLKQTPNPEAQSWAETLKARLEN